MTMAMAQLVLKAAGIGPQLLQRHFVSPKIASVTLRRQYGDLRARGLKLPEQIEMETTEKERRKRRNRSEMKREARDSVKWGMDLASFTPPQIQLILKAASLEKQVFEALMLVKKLGPDVREGKRRQFNYIGKLLRDAQPELLAALIQATKDGDNSRLHALAASVNSTEEVVEAEFDESDSESEEEESSKHVVLANRWLDGLLNKDIQISNEVYSIDIVEFDRQELRRLVRNVQSMQDWQKNVSENSEKSDADVLAANLQLEVNENSEKSEADVLAAKKSLKRIMAAKKSLNSFLCSLARRYLRAQEVVL